MTEKKQFRVVCMITEPTLNDAIVTAVRVGNNIEGVDVSLTQRINDPTVGTIVDSRNVYAFIQGQNAIEDRITHLEDIQDRALDKEVLAND